jgi:site-specific recombinase XerD
LLGLSTRIVPHQFRHTYATEMLGSGVSFTVLMTLLGQTNPEITMRYVEVVSADL